VRELHRRRSGLMVLQQRGVVHVVAVDAGSPAAAAEIRVGDIVSKAGGVTTRGMPLWQLRSALAGDRGAALSLELVRRGAAIEKTISLAEFPRPPVVRRVVDGINVVRIPQLEHDAVAALDRELATLAADAPLVLDLRGAVDGDPEAAFAVAERFTSGALGTLRRGEEVLRRFESASPPRHRGPLTLLVDGTSLGAAEILATVLKQKDAASVIGEPTFGYAGRSELVRLSSGAYLELTVSFYAGPDGVLLRKSVEPDEVVWSRNGEPDESQRDDILDRAIELLLGRGVPASERRVA
jgi:carboxyl-terminal processing protease